MVDTAIQTPGMEEVIDEEELGSMIDLFLNEGGTFQDLHGLSDKEMEAVYGIAYTLYESGKYEEALQVFQFLCFNNHYEKRYWVGLGATQQMRKAYEEALQAYAFAAVMDLDDPSIPLHAARCCMALERFKDAEKSLEAASALAEDKAEHADTKARADALLELVVRKTGEDRKNG